LQKEAASLVLEFFDGDKKKSALWWSLKNPLLGGISPKDMVRLGRSKRLLEWIKIQLAENKPAQEGAMRRAEGVGHAGDRLSERFGIKMDGPAHQELQGLIKNCKWKPVSWQASKLKVELEFRGKKMQVVFETVTKKIITIIPSVDKVEMVALPPVKELMATTPEELNRPNTRKTKDPNCKVCHGEVPVGFECRKCEG
jgi:hypothetical protein